MLCEVVLEYKTLATIGDWFGSKVVSYAGEVNM